MTLNKLIIILKTKLTGIPIRTTVQIVSLVLFIKYNTNLEHVTELYITVEISQTII